MQAPLENEEKKSNDTIESELDVNVSCKLCSLCEMYNLVQQRISLYDLRSAKKYTESHITDAMNMPNPMEATVLNDSNSNIFVFYADKNEFNNDLITHLTHIAKVTFDKSLNKSNKTKQKLQSLYQKTVNEKDQTTNTLYYKGKSKQIKPNVKTVPPIYIFYGDFNDFYRKYQFLCNGEQIQYPNAIVMDELYLGDGFMSENKTIVLNLGITHIINVTKCFFVLDENIKKTITYLQLQIEDSSADTIAVYFDKACEFIDQALSKNKENEVKSVVFVHCMAGVSRSASIIIAYLMKVRRFSLCDAYIHVKRCRPRISPNRGFFKELVGYETKLFGKSTKDQLDKDLIRYE